MYTSSTNCWRCERRHARHAFAVRDADAIEIRIFLEHLRDALAQVTLRDVGGVAGHVVVRVEILLGDVVRLRELFAHEDAPEHDVGVEPALLRHAEDLAVQVLPLGELRVGPLAGFGEIRRPDHVSERMHGPQADRVETVLDHHVEKGLPEREVACSRRSAGRARSSGDSVSQGVLNLMPRKASAGFALSARAASTGATPFAVARATRARRR